MVRDYQAIIKTWFPKGRQLIIPTYGKHRGVKLLGILNYETGRVYCMEEERLQLVFLPPYSPKLNLVEGLWFWLKHSVIYNAFYSTVNEIRDAVNGFIESISGIPEQIIDRLCVKM